MMRWPIRRHPGRAHAGTTAASEGTGGQGRLLPTSRLEAFSDGVFAIAITLLVLELHVPTGREALVAALEHEWPRYLGYFVSFAFIGGVWIAHSNMTRFIKAADPALMRLNLTLLLFVSFLPFTTAIVATHLFATFLPLSHLTVFHAGTPAERVAVVLFGLNLTLAALMVYRVIRYAARTPGIAADDVAEVELQAFAKERRAAALLQAGATVVGAFLPVIAVAFYLAVSVVFIVEPLRRVRIRGRRAPQPR
jgi:TMEM175 potassium channel family protein